jgi:hypothetical protein
MHIRTLRATRETAAVAGASRRSSGAERLSHIHWLFATSLLLAWISPAVGLVNPQLQPSHLIERHQAVAGFEATKVDYDKGLVTLAAVKVCFGQFAPKTVTIDVPEVDFDEDSLLDELAEGDTVVAYIGKRRRRHEQDVLLYTGSQ